MKSILRQLFSLLLIFLILNQDLLISAHTLTREKHSHESRILASRASPTFKAIRDRAESSSNSTHLKHSRTKASTETETEKAKQLETLLIIAIVFIVLIIVAAVAKKIVDRVVKKELEFLSKEVNKQKVQVMEVRKKENKMYIEFCLGYQKMSRLFKAYSLLTRLHKEEITDTLLKIKAQLPGSAVKDQKTFTELSKIDQTRFKTFAKTASKKLNSAMNENCFNAYRLRNEFVAEEVLGDDYAGFSEEEFALVEQAMQAHKAGMKEYAGAAGGVLVEEALETTLGSDAAETIILMKDATETGKPTESFKIVKMGEEGLKFMDYFRDSATIGASLVNIGMKIKEIKELAQSENCDNTFRRIFKYLMMGLEIMDNLFSMGGSIANLITTASASFPFTDVLVKVMKFADSLLDYVEKNTAYKADLTNPGKKMSKDFKYWDSFDAGFAAVQSVAQTLLTLIAPATVGASTIIKLGINLFFSVTSLFFSVMKLKKVRALKNEIVAYLSKKTTAFVDEADKVHKRLVNEKCAHHSTFLRNFLDSELSELDENLMLNERALANLLKGSSASISEEQLKTTVIQQNTKILTAICKEDNQYCPEFLDALTIDKTFINADVNLKALLKKVGQINSMGSANSVISVYKGMVSTEGPVAADQDYAVGLTEKLLSSEYDPVYQSPRFDVFVCRGCGDQSNRLAEVQNFLNTKELKEVVLKDATKYNVVQDSLQFVNVNKKETDEISEYLVGVYDKVQTTDFKEFTFNDPTVSTRHFIFSKRNDLDSTNFRVPLVLNSKPHLGQLFDSLILFSLHQQIVGEAINRLNLNQKVNIVNVKIHMKNQEQNPSHYFVLCLSKKTDVAKIIADTCSGLTDKKRCVAQNDGFSKPLDEVRHGYKFALFNADYPGITLDLFKKNGWNTGFMEFTFGLSSEHVEEVTLQVLYKKTIQFQGFVAPTGTSVKLSIMDQLEEMKNEKLGDMFKYLKDAVCNAECGEALPPRIRYGPKKTEKTSVCDMDEAKWLLAMENQKKVVNDSQKCVYETYCKAFKSFWTQGVKSLVAVPNVSSQYTCSSTAKICGK